MKRTIYEELKKWKNSSRRKPLLMKGARQVGKTWLLKEFGKNEYEKTAYFNFEETPELDEIFSFEIVPKKIIDKLSILIGWNIEREKHLIIFDEIQLSNKALNSLKYFFEKENSYHIVSAGSLLGLMTGGKKSFPVGKVNFLHLLPMSFIEFLDACNEDRLRALLQDKKTLDNFPNIFHQRLSELLRNYYFVGGMPEAVKYFVKNNDSDEVREIQNEIIQAYRFDFSKHASPFDIPKLSEVWDSIPRQLARENKKFVFSIVRNGARGREYINAIKWLEDAGLILKAFSLQNVKLPLKSYADRNVFKIYTLDIGILGALIGISPQAILLRNDLFKPYEGAFVENYVAQQIYGKLGELYYWTSSGIAEVDFIFQFNDKVYPLEVKAGINPKSKSLRIYQEKYNPDLLLRSTFLNLKKDKDIINLPLYAISQLDEIL